MLKVADYFFKKVFGAMIEEANEMASIGVTIEEDKEIASTLIVVWFLCSGDGTSNIYFKVLEKENECLYSYR